MIEVWGANRVGVRLSPVNSFNSMSDSRPEETFTYAARELSRLAPAYLHIVEIDRNGAAAGKGFDWRQIRDAFNGLYIANSGYDQARANAALARGAADLVAFGTLYIANPDLAARFAAKAALNTPDPATFYGGDERGYTDYPSLTSV